MNAFRSLFMIAAGSLVLASCASAEREDNGDRQTDELGAIEQQPDSGVCSGGKWSCKARVRTDTNHAIKPFVTPSGLGPADLASAYKLDPNKTSTATVAIVDAFAYPNAASDLATYRSQFGLPPCTVANGCLIIDNAQGAGNAPANDDWTVEAALDLDLVSAACPTCKIILINAKDDQGNGLFTAQHQAANHAGVVAISDSWGGPSDGSDLSENTQFFAIPNVNIFVASGDNGNTGTSPDVPSTLANVIGVGGTSLVKSTTATRGWTEGAWNGAGSSCSKLTTKPSFQSVVPTAACSKRAAADVSAVADPNTGLAVFNAGAGGWIVVGGTSAAAPFVAGVYARYGITKSNDASFSYTHASQFFDVTTGKNGTCGSALCNAGAGWDGPTGIGTPNGAVLGGTGTCVPTCTGKTCGDDGCGGSCGTCGTGQTCSPGGTCTGGGSCTHPICSTGAKLTASCDPCATQICAADSFCCNNTWDSQCVGEVASVCHQTCGGGTCAHPICSTGTKLTASCDACATKICNADSFCCNNTWDSQCVSEVSSVCHQSCN
jgi:Subtilase family